ncbi:hypothetical protein PR001_g17446 [Phytophthora rubi]|uniref:Integrase catalytic domain-containing protein n=1 Tax=Phytophthora rubi TaxID=129364 RepID=A0A6A3KFV1_9STRA|nr:hypothetical protein PR001_g17446 [Phytophthora rubi]
MLWEWLVMPQWLSNAPATFNRLVTQLFRPMRHFVQTYFDDIFVHSRASEGKTDVEAHLDHLREDGVRADPEKVCAIAQWSVPVSQKDLRKWIGLANYLHKYSANYAEMARPLTNLLKMDAVWSWTSEAQKAFEAIKSSPQSAPILALPDEDRFAEYNFTVEYKPGKQNVIVNALSRRPDCELAHLAYLESPLYELIREAYADDDDLAGLVETLSAPTKTVELTARQRSRLRRYSVVEGLLYYQVDGGDEPRIVVPNNEDLRHRVLYEAYDTPLSGHLGREKTYTSVARNFWWAHMYKMGTKLVRLAVMRKSVTPPQAVQLFVDNVFRHHGIPGAFVSDRAPRFVSHFWQHLFRLLGTRLDMSTVGHPQTDGQTERVNRVLEDILRSVCAAGPTKWSTLLPQVEFAPNNAVHSSTGFTPFYVNGLQHPRTPLTLPPASNLGGG